MTPNFISLCKRGPTFVPTRQHVDWLQLQKDLDNFINAMRREINRYHPESNSSASASKPNTEDEISPPFKPKFSRVAKCNNRAVEVFLDCFTSEIFNNTTYKPPKHNLPPCKREAKKCSI